MFASYAGLLDRRKDGALPLPVPRVYVMYSTPCVSLCTRTNGGALRPNYQFLVNFLVQFSVFLEKIKRARTRNDVFLPSAIAVSSRATPPTDLLRQLRQDLEGIFLAVAREFLRHAAHVSAQGALPVPATRETIRRRPMIVQVSQRDKLQISLRSTQLYSCVYASNNTSTLFVGV